MTQAPQLAGEIVDLTVSFHRRPVLERLSFSFPRQRITVIIGPSGSGKTTLLRALNRLNELFPGCVTQGRVFLYLEGAWVDIYQPGLAVTELRRRVGLVFQQPQVLPLSIAQNLLLPLKLVRQLQGAAAVSRMRQALEEAQLWDEVKDRLEAPAGTLSGGQQQRLCLARALALEPEILLLDEPCASLDFRAAARIEELLLHLKHRYTIVAVSHSLSQARRLADQILVLKEGRLAQRLTPALFLDPNRFSRLLEEIF